MDRLTYPQLVELRAEFDAAVAGSAGLAGTCSLSPWQLAAHDAMHGAAIVGEAPRRHLICRREGAWVALIEAAEPGVFVPFEPVWMFASPLAGDPAAAVALLQDACLDPGDGGPVRAVMLGGVPKDGVLFQAVCRSAKERGQRLGFAEGTESMVLDLDAGVDGWLGRRSANFRRAARRAERRVAEVQGWAIEDGSALDPDEAFDRILLIQRQSYKASMGEDIFSMPEYRAFYRALFRDVHLSGELRLSFALNEGVPLAFNFGFTRGADYRGYQMSYAESARGKGVGTALQMTQLRRAEAEGVLRFDLGMHAPYKERWADRSERTVILVLEP